MEMCNLPNSFDLEHATPLCNDVKGAKNGLEELKNFKGLCE
jgi:hypothetical protein